MHRQAEFTAGCRPIHTRAAGRRVGTADPGPSGTGPETAGSRHLVRTGIALVGAVYVVYLGLLITCDVLRVAPLGFVPRFERGRVTVRNLAPGSTAAQAGLLEGDRIVGVDGQVLETQTDWHRVGVYLDPSRPMVVELDRNGARVRAELKLSAGFEQWLRPSRGAAFSHSDWRRSSRWASPSWWDSGARSSHRRCSVRCCWHRSPRSRSPCPGAWRCSGTPFRLHSRRSCGFHLLRVPPPDPMLFAFAAVFPRRVLSARAIAIQLLPAVPMAGWHLHAGLRVMSELGPPTGVANDVELVFLGNVIYAGTAIALFVAHWNAASTQTDRRRIGVLMLGTTVSSVAAIPLLISYWRDPGGGVFATPARTLFSLVFLAMPASFAYAILRHRLFDVRLIVRQGLRYALARRSLDSLIPLLGALLVFDAFVHRDQPLVSLVQPPLVVVPPHWRNAAGRSISAGALAHRRGPTSFGSAMTLNAY